jgi:hypothetical protein
LKSFGGPDRRRPNPARGHFDRHSGTRIDTKKSGPDKPGRSAEERNECRWHVPVSAAITGCGGRTRRHQDQ